METEEERQDEKALPTAGSLIGRKLARELIFAAELAIAIPITLSVILSFVAEKRALIKGTAGHMRQETALLTQLVQREAVPAERQRLLDMYCQKMVYYERPGHYMVVMSSAGNILASNVAGMENGSVASALRSRIAKRESGKDEPTRAMIDGVDALELTARIGSVTDPEDRAILYYSEPLTDINQTVWSMLRLRVILLGLAFLVTFGSLWVMIKRKVSDPLWRLYLGQLDVWEGARGHLRGQAPGNEIGQLYVMHNAMVDKIQEHEKALVTATNVAEAGRVARRVTREIKHDTTELLKMLRELSDDNAIENRQVRQVLTNIADREQEILKKLAEFELAATGSHEVLVNKEFDLLGGEDE